ncbi:3-methyl-2-oxobutanoate dehydrogenase subunit VorB [Desulfosporosinus sp. BICA1-9]|uniref:3-methyl-2-oxobutanoate dehydrogenase subunit VorB n=1 Tax=Desulfosporosinus sp. BICA1-9 TaxID=1531958 RepID=UPI00054B7D3B|nr:3-methyl-2-oxobutanoate dehydrogenase subunit VorB [Desulfosporosinus sp. BICA1-9]KJS49833.1 MAG: 2-ketoisovalerate ferredoxin oxidoreductase [Peptococcaceae bacterium BRH_c23]KJS81972.1 MAG: 2-ketoisovalerate ferredoxin oxidoreductase [Desulfosporosinus sp. BICA1-9]HBW35760.1 3-methyl-2-oxobutanoate dehydrogenase subunit VorB [Desulfosporosinus sp.]
MAKVLMKGNEALAEAAIRAGCRYFFGYPITPQNEIPQYLARHLPEVGGVFVQAESEIAAINMVYGAAGAGARVMTSSSGPGISLKQEGISYIACAELPCVIVNMQRGGPGLGGIQPAQSDYFQAVKGGGHGDYKVLVLAPATVQEMVDLIGKAFDLADEYRNPVMILGDGILGQMMETVEFSTEKIEISNSEKPWATTGAKGRKPNLINSLFLDPVELEKHNLHLQLKFESMAKEVLWENYQTDDAELILVGYGTSARIAKAVVDQARALGIKAGLFRPISLFPFPKDALQEACRQAKHVLTVEMSMGQLVEDVRYNLEFKIPVHLYGRVGGMVPTARAVLEEVKRWVSSGEEAGNA